MKFQPILLLAAISIILSASCQKEEVHCDSIFQKKEVTYKGVSFVSPSNPVGGEAFQSIIDVNANAVSLIPFGFVYANDSIVHHNANFQWWGEKDEGIASLVNDAHQKNLTTMVKPQIWLVDGTFTGHFEMSSESEWITFENSYLDYIVHFAHLADSLNCEAFCIGTEFERFAHERPDFWSTLIDTVRTEFSGALTYAENWDAYDKFPHWSKLDFIGIDAYFPISNKKTPTVEQARLGWQTHYSDIKELQSETNIPVVFTEFGYRSKDNSGKEPWDTSSEGTTNLEAQDNLLKGLYYTFWDQEWFEGGFVWKWFPDHASAGGDNNNRFTPQNKPAEQTLRAIYKKE